MSLVLTYYLEINAVCMIILGIILFLYSKEKRGKAESLWYKALIWSLFIYCITDMIAIVCRGRTGLAARSILWIVNTIYVTLPLLLVIFWGKYTSAQTKLFYDPGKKIEATERIMYAAAIIISVVSFTTPFTGFTFTLNEENIYQRQPGTYIIPIVSYSMFAYLTAKMFIISRKCESLEGKRCARVLTIFAFPCILFSCLQVFMYGSTMAQAGYTIAVLIIYVGIQQTQVLKDALTGLNNRREYENNIDRLVRGKGGKLMIAMIDVDNFKQINDSFGHIEGDNALQEVAQILKDACHKCNQSHKLAIYRYGGDEFVILSSDHNDDMLNVDLRQALEEAEKEWNDNRKTAYPIHLSMGSALGTYENEDDLRQIIAEADSKMYQIKAARKKR